MFFYKLPDRLQAYGYVILNGDLDNAEWGYINIEELKNSNKVELDFYWTPIKFKELKTGETNEQQNNHSHTNNSSAASGELDSERQRERLQTNERDSGNSRNQGQRIVDNENHESEGYSRKNHPNETDEHGNRGYGQDAQRIGVSGGLNPSDPSSGVIDEEKFKKFAEFLKKAGL